MRNESLNYELANFHNYLKANKLSLNVNKTKAMVFHMPQKRIQLPLIKIAGEDIAFVDNFNFLGIIINKHLNWTSHVDMLSAKLSKTIGILNTLKHVLPINIMRTLYTSLIICHLNYGVLLWGPKLRDNDNLHILQKKAVRIITSSSYFAHSEPLFKQLRLLKTCDIYKCVLLKFIFKLTHKQLPHYFEQFTFTFRNQQHNYATRTCQNVSIPNVNHEFAKRSIRFIAPSAYNSTRRNIIDKIYTHSFVGFCIYVKFQLIDSYNIVCSTRNCFSCRRHIQ